MHEFGPTVFLKSLRLVSTADSLALPPPGWHVPCKEALMLHYAIVFFIVALIAGVLGFWGVAGLAAEIAKILCLVFIVLMVISLFRGRTPRI